MFFNRQMIQDELIRYLNQPLIVGSRRIDGRLVLAPLTFLGNVAFRELLAHFGGYGLLFSEMCWAGSVPCGNGHDQGGYTWRTEEDLSELVCQIFGNDPQTKPACLETGSASLTQVTTKPMAALTRSP